MPTLQFFSLLLDWLKADITHVIIAFAALSAFLPRPKPGTWAARVFSVIDVLALNIYNAKPGVSTTAALEEQIKALLAQQMSAVAAQARITPPNTPVVPPHANPQ